jgi:hypothetical protein
MTAPTISAIENVAQTEEGSVLKGTVYIAGILHHVYFIEVYEDEKDELQYAVDDPSGYYDQLQEILDGSYCATVEVDGHDGDYVVLVVPSTE